MASVTHSNEQGGQFTNSSFPDLPHSSLHERAVTLVILIVFTNEVNKANRLFSCVSSTVLSCFYFQNPSQLRQTILSPLAVNPENLKPLMHERMPTIDMTVSQFHLVDSKGF
jgi:hypothetical protein